MARYIGPKNKLSRKFGEALYGKERKTNYNRQYGNLRRRGKQSEYSIQLLEKQKMKYIYGILEKQCRKMFLKASKSKGLTGEVLLQFMESRLDNVVYRMGLAVSRQAARQLVSHGHLLVNENKNNIPSYLVKPGDTISLRKEYKNNHSIKENLRKNNSTVEWLFWNMEKMCGIFKYIPERKKIPETINEQLVVEWYSK